MTQFDKLYTSREKLVKTVLDLEEQISQGGGGGGTSFSDLGYSSFDSTATYSKGDVVEKDGTLYEFTTSHTGDWDASDVQETSVEALIKDSEQPMAIVAASGTALTASVDNYYLFGSEVGTLAITLTTPSDTTHITKAVFMLTTGSTPAVTFAGASGINVIAQDGFSIEASTTYEINAIFNGTAWIVAAMKLSTTPINS